MSKKNDIYKIVYDFQHSEYSWRIWIDAADFLLDKVTHVEYEFDSPLSIPKKVIDDRQAKFSTGVKNVQAFTLKATILLNDNSTVILEKKLYFKLEIINKARDVIRGSQNMNIDELDKLRKDLEAADQFAYATEILLRIFERKENDGHKIPLKDHQTLAKYIYKDHSLPSSFKFEKALLELKTNDDLLLSDNTESLGLAGAIYKRKWKFDHQFTNLILSKFYYEKGYEKWQSFIKAINAGKPCKDECNDEGYTAINYAYINELMAVDKIQEFDQSTGLTAGVIRNLDTAERIRGEILDEFIVDKKADVPQLKPGVKDKTEKNPWIISTIAEAFFGLYEYDKSEKFIKEYLDLQLKALRPWEIRSFSQQMFSLAYLQISVKQLAELHQKETAYDQLKERAFKTDKTKINKNLNLFVGEKAGEAKIEIKKEGKLGIALSGGGFRASLFHIGVLAALAEYDELKNIEIISCVSGGSIIGAYYYLKLKELVEKDIDKDISCEHYINIVKDTETHFLKGVQKNLRMRIFTNIFLNIRMLFDANYSRSHRIGELYEKYFYQPLTGKKHLYMDDLFINPKLMPGETFSFSTDNWRREHKIPQLVLNATSVNTGHNWQFTASWMGEPPGNIQTDIDVKPRLRRMYYEEAPDNYKKFRVGYAVGASACVPVMFHPMPMFDLYPGIDLQLIDGGLHDNQGIAALIEEECNSMIISDASGQMPTNDIATENEAAVFWRADNILQERIRELQFMDIKEREYTTQLDMLLKLHLKNGLKTYPKKWKNCIDPARKIYDEEVDPDEDLLKFDILRDSQELLSVIRTDLDSFNDIEANALMYSGYAQTNYELHQRGKIKQYEHNWNFLKIKDYVKFPDKAKKVEKILYTARKQPFKVLEISKPLKISYAILRILLLIAALLPVLGLICGKINIPLCGSYSFGITTRSMVYFLMAVIFWFVLRWVLKKWVLKRIRMKITVLNNPLSLGIVIVLWVLFNVYILFFNWIYNKAGSMKDF